MKKILTLFSLLIGLSSIQSCENCHGNSGHIPTDTRVSSCFFKAGSYFVYNNSTDQITDSEFVFSYSYKKDAAELYHVDQCVATGDEYDMHLRSFHNGTYVESLYAISTRPNSLSINDTSFNTFDYYIPSDTLVFQNFAVSGVIYTTVYRNYHTATTISNGDTIPTDIYVAPDYGIVRRTEHRRTGDVNWDLVRSHIVR